MWKKDEEETSKLNMGSRYKTPNLPVWVSCVNGNWGVLFSPNKDLLKSENRWEKRASLGNYNWCCYSGSRSTTTATFPWRREMRPFSLLTLEVRTSTTTTVMTWTRMRWRIHLRKPFRQSKYDLFYQFYQTIVPGGTGQPWTGMEFNLTYDIWHYIYTKISWLIISDQLHSILMVVRFPQSWWPHSCKSQHFLSSLCW